MKAKKLFFVLAVAAITLVAGCATGKNGEAAKVEAAGKPYTVRRITLPEQQKGELPFLVRRAKYLERFTEKELAPAIVVSEYLEVLAKTSRTPFRVREGFLIKEKKRYWYLIEWPVEKVYRPPCVGYNIYHIVDLKAVR